MATKPRGFQDGFTFDHARRWATVPPSGFRRMSDRALLTALGTLRAGLKARQSRDWNVGYPCSNRAQTAGAVAGFQASISNARAEMARRGIAS
jgi:hypothetical protein